MTFEYVDLDTARTTDGVRMTVVSGIPSPWSEAAKGILHLKNASWKAVRHSAEDPALHAWTGCTNAPVLKYNDESTRAGWVDILLFAESLIPTPNLLPKDPEARAMALGLSHEFMGEEGLCWSRRLQLVHGGKQTQGAGREHADYIGAKYGYRQDQTERVDQRVVELLTLFSRILNRQKSLGSAYYLGGELTVVDIYSAAAMALFAPLPLSECAMDPATHTAFGRMTDNTRERLSPLLLEHREMMYEQHLQRPLSL